MKYAFCGIVMAAIFWSFVGIEPQLKRIRQDGYDLEFYVIPHKTIAPKKDRMYYWFSSGEVHYTMGDYTGDLLDGIFTKESFTNELVEKGRFNDGLKQNVWRSWYPNGKIYEEITYHQGAKQGGYKLYDSIGGLLEKGKYTNDQRTGAWINYATQDTVFFKKGETFVPKVKDTTRPSFFKRVKNFFTKKDEEGLEANSPKKKRRKKNIKNAS